MQKKLIALAIAGLVSGGAFAQSTVSITGMMDFGYQNFKIQTAGTDYTTQHFGSGANSGTANVTLNVVEDLGNGMKAGLLLETDPANGTSTGAAFMNSQNFMFLNTKMGNVKLGFYNNQALVVAAAVMQPFGTGMGSGYSAAFGRLDGVNVIGAPAGVVGVADALNLNANGNMGGAGARDVRINNAMEYTTPTWNGFNVNLQVKSQNSNGVAVGNDGQLGWGANYNNGPINVGYAKSQTNGIVGGINAAQVDNNLLGGNYTFGTVTVYGGWTSSIGSNNAAGTSKVVDSRSWNLALKWQATPALSIAGNVLKVDDKMTGNQDRKLTALGADYGLSKRTFAYGRYETGDNDNANSQSGKFNRFALGLRHTF